MTSELRIAGAAASPDLCRCDPNSANLNSSADSRNRLASIDMMRALVMLIMLLDHVRERFFLHQQVSDPMDVLHTEPALFFSRLAAHWCAPVFVFLTGVSAYLYQQSGRALTPFLLKRGLVLLALELTLVNFSWLGSYQTVYLQVIWVIGLCMLLLALLHRLPARWLLLLALLLIGAHNALTFIQFRPEEWGYSLWTVLHDRGYLWQGAPFHIKVSYPLLPWVGVIVAGFLAGRLYRRDYPALLRQAQLTLAGVTALCLLFVLRSLNLYGETLDWQVQPTLLLTVMDWLNFTKYPPSLDFLLLTLGLMALALGLLERLPPARWQQWLSTFGAAPMFFYLLHLYTLLVLASILKAWFGPTHGDLYCVEHIGWVWAISVALALLLFWPTRAFARYKQRSQAAWVRYL